MSVFHAYDIRGFYPSEVNEDFVRTIGRLLKSFLGIDKIMVATDARNGSSSLKDSLISGLLESGVDVVYVGVCSTPQAYFSQKYLKLEAAVMVTASHNPPEFNGLKIMGRDAMPVGRAQGLDRLEAMFDAFEEDSFDPVEKMGSLKDEDLSEEYYDFMLMGLKDKFSTRLVVDNSNSPAVVECRALREIADVVSLLNPDSDPEFSGHGPDPSGVNAQVQVREAIISNHADLGVIFDGDADRVIFLDESGRMVPSDVILSIIASENDSGKVICDVGTGRAAIEKISSLGLEPVISKVGRSNMIINMKEYNAVLGGEKSGHLYFRETGYLECVALAVRKVLFAMNKSSKSLSELSSELTSKYCSSPVINFHVEDVEASLHLLEEEFKGGKISHLDGLMVHLDDGSWFNIRPSNTEPRLLRLMIAEADDAGSLKMLINRIRRLLE